MRVRIGLMTAMSLCAAGLVMAEPGVGESAPPIEAKNWYNLPPGIKGLGPEHLKGKVVMVEFWATW